MNSSHAFSQSRTIARTGPPRSRSARSAQPGPGSVHGGVDGLDVPLEGIPVPLGGEPEGVADRVSLIPTSA